MAVNFPQVGVSAVIEGLQRFEQGSKTINKAYDEMNVKADKVEKSSASLSGRLGDLTGTLLKMGTAITGTVLVGVGSLGVALSGFAVGGIKKATDLDQKMSDIAATMGIAKSQTTGLKDLIFDLSLNPNLTVNATQAAEAIEVLAANGAELVDSMGNVTEAGRELTTQVVAMSNATGADFALSAAIATDAMNIFGLEAQEMGKAVDGATGVMVASKFGANDYALALANAGSIAAGMGVDITDFNTVIAATASQFASGSDAGTSFKALLQRLANPTDKIRETMAAYGISLFDSNGQMRDMSAISGQLNSAFDGLTEAQKASLAATLGGADGARILLGIAKLNETQFSALSAKVNETGQGLRAAATRVDSFKGAMEILEGVVEAIQLQVGDKFLPILRRVTVGFTDLASRVGPLVVDFFGEIAEEIGKTLDFGVKMVAVFSKIGTATAKIFTGGKGAVELFTALRELGVSTDVSKTIANITLSISGLVDRLQDAFAAGGIMGVFTELGSTIRNVWTSTIQPALLTWANNFWNWLLYDVIPEIPGQVTNLVDTLSEDLRTGWDTVSSTLTGWAGNFWNWLTETVIPAIPGQLDKLIVGISDYLNSQFPSVGASFDSIVATITQSINKIQGAFDRFGFKGAAISILGQLGMDPETIGQIDTTITQIVTTITGGFDKIQGAYNRFGLKGAGVSLLGQLGMDPETIGLIDTTITSIVDKITTFVDNVKLAYDRFGGQGAAFSILGQLGVGSDTLVTLQQTLDGIVSGITEFVTQVQETFAGGAETGGLGGGFSAVFESWKTSALEALPVLAGEILAAIPATLTTITDAIGEHFRTNVPAFQEAMAEWTPKFWEWVNTVIDGAGAALAGVLLSITAWATSSEAQGSLNEAGSEIGKTIVTGIRLLFENVNELGAVMVKLSGGLLAAAAVIAGDLILIGGQIVAGILSGMLEEMGVSVKPAMISELQGILQGLAENSMTIIREVTKRIVKAIADGLKTAWATGVDLEKELAEFLNETKDILTSPDKWLEIGGDIIKGLISGLSKNQDKVLEFFKGVIGEWVSGVKSQFGIQSPSTVFADIGSDLVQGVVAGARSEAGSVAATFQNLGQSAIDTLMTGMRVTDTSFIHDFIDSLDMGGIGKAAGAGGGQWRNFRNILINEITAGMSGLESGTINFMDKITEVANRFQFPPNLAREFAQAEGLVEHLTSTFGTMFQKLRIENMAAAIGIANNFSSIGSSFADMVQKQIDAFEKSKAETISLGTENTKLTGTLVEQQTELAELQAELLKLSETETEDTEAKKKKQEQIAKLTAEINKNKLAIEANQKAMEAARQKLMDSAIGGFRTDATSSQKLEADLARIQLLQEFLAGSQNQLVVSSKLQTVYGEVLVEQTYDRAKAQAELNQLTAEQARREQEIIKQREAQAKLDFLGQQISLIKLISDRGLNPKDILGGITLGLQAGATDLLAATNKVVEAMVNQINQDLQIHSPSAVMARIGQQIMAGLQGGILSMTPALNAQLSASVAGPISPMMAGAMGRGGDTYNYNSYQLGGNNIYNQTDEAIFESRVLQVIRRNL